MLNNPELEHVFSFNKLYSSITMGSHFTLTLHSTPKLHIRFQSEYSKARTMDSILVGLVYYSYSKQ